MKPLDCISQWKVISPFANGTPAQFNLSPFPGELWPQKSPRLLELIRICIFQENALFQKHLKSWLSATPFTTKRHLLSIFSYPCYFFLSPCHFLHFNVYLNFPLCPLLWSVLSKRCIFMLPGKEQITGKKELGVWAMYPSLHHQAFEQDGISKLKSTEIPTAPV